MFDPNADPELIAARAAELSLEQMDRLSAVLKVKGQPAVPAFYSHPFEIQTSNQIASLMGAYAVLKGLVPAERINRD